MKRFLFLLVLVLFALPAIATDFAGNQILVPIAGRTSGALGSQWNTDLFVTNTARQGEGTSVSIVFVNQSGQETVVQVQLAAGETRSFPDAIRSTFLQDSATGMIRIVASSGDDRITARARIYNTGAGRGEFGQTVQAEPLAKLSRRAYLPGLTAAGGNRTNVGIANPAETTATVFLMLHEADGASLSGFSVQIPPRSVRLFNEVFSHFQFPPSSLDNAAVAVNASHGVYAYASIVRAGSGDADFVAGTGVEIDDRDALVAPPCTNPSRLGLAPLPAEGWIVLFDDAADPFGKTASLEAEHGFTAQSVYVFGGFFVRELSQTKIAALRCEETVRMIEQNGRVPIQ
jgi:hypothetical protein